ncbi:MAG: DUF87 domain-containing protein, partial [Thermoplasmata archaeon]
MTWIVIGEENGAIKLVSKRGTPGLLPKGAYLTVESEDNKFLLRVEKSYQDSPYSPSPLIVDMNLPSLPQDRKCQNIIYATRIKDFKERDDGLINYIIPQSIARLSTQEEINDAIGNIEKGPEVFLAVVHSHQNQILKDNEGRLVTVKLPEEMFFHQTLICGKTGSGKTVAAKYLAQYFVEELQGAVLAVNVKDVDFLQMDKKSETVNPDTLREWQSLKKEPHGIDNFTIFFPATIDFSTIHGINRNRCKKITLNVKKINPDALAGLLQGITDIGAQSLPGIFRYWRKKEFDKGNNEITFKDFVEYFARGENDGRIFPMMNERDEELPPIQLHPGTFQNLRRILATAISFFDNPDAEILEWNDILYPGKMSVINVAGGSGTIEFGAVLLRDILSQIVEAKSKRDTKVPILIIIDEV